MAKKATPQIWSLTINNEARKLLFVLLANSKPGSMKEQREQTRAMDALEDGDDLASPTPSLDDGMVSRIGELFLRAGVTPEIVESLAVGLKKTSLPEKDTRTITITLDNIESIVEVYKAALTSKSIANLEGRKVMRLIDACNSVKEEGEGVPGILTPDRVSEEEAEKEAEKEAKEPNQQSAAAAA